MGALAYAYPRDEVVMPIPVGFFMMIRRIKVIYAVILFAALETIFVYLGGRGNTAHFAHLGGLISGAIIAAVIIRNRTHTKVGETIYYDSYASQKPSKIDISELEKLALTPELKETLEKIKNEDVPQVRDVWIENFFEKAICPKCSKPLNHFDNKICRYI